MTKEGVIFDKKNVLIIGGAGFVGSHLADELVKEAKVVCVDNFLTGQKSNISHLLQNVDFELINHDIINPVELEKQSELEKFKVEFQGVQEIYFLASPTSPHDYNKNPIKTILVNSVGLRNALDMAVKYKAKFFYASSPAVYGQVASSEKIKEDYLGVVDQLGPRSCYEEAKRFGESLVENYRKKHNIDTKIARIFNCYGPRMRLDDGRMIPEMSRQALAEGDVIVHGKKSDQASYFYISDLVVAIIKMMDSGNNGPINLASDSAVTFGEIAQKIIDIAESSSKIKEKKMTELMSPQILADIRLAKEELGWFPIVLIEDGLKKTIDYLDAQEEVIDPENL